MVRHINQENNKIVFSDKNIAVKYCVEQFIAIGIESIKERGKYVVALSGGSTPNAIFKMLSENPYCDQLDWSKVYFFWSDERNVPLEHPDSNYKSAMEAGIGSIRIPSNHIFRMHGEDPIEEHALDYERQIKRLIPDGKFDFIMLGMGEDGHTASLFPYTKGLNVFDRLVIANEVPQKNTWRMTLTFSCIAKARHVCLYVFGAGKAPMIADVFLGKYEPDRLPVQRVTNALWIMDEEANALL